MKKMNKKGFTIVELVIVIAVIAILAAVLIPTYANLVKKANKSVDEQLVAQMNKILLAEELTDGKNATVYDARDVLTKNGISQFKPVDEEYVFYWISTDNRVVLYNITTDKVTYPKEYVGKTKSESTWKDLSVVEADQGVTQITPVEGQSMATTLLSAVKNAQNGDVIRLPENQIVDMEGRGFGIGQALQGTSGLGKSVTIDLNGSTLDCTAPYTNGYHYQIDVPVGGTLEIINGSIKYNMDADNEPALSVKSGASLVLRNVDFTTEKGAAIYPNGDASEVIVDECTITGDKYGIATNAIQSNNVRITVTNSTIQAASAVLINTQSEVEIDNCNITAKGWGLIVREGYVTVSNTTITTTDGDVGTGTEYSCGYKDFSYTQNSAGAPYWGQGFQMPYSVVTVGDYSNGTAYNGASTLIMTNVKLVSPNANDIPDILLAAQMTGKTVNVTYDESSTVGKIVVFGQEYTRLVNKALPTFEHKGTMTVNGESKTLP